MLIRHNPDHSEEVLCVLALDKRFLLASFFFLASRYLWANNWAYSAACSFLFWARWCFSRRSFLFWYNLLGVMRRWIFGAFVLGFFGSFLPSFTGSGRLITCLRTSSSLDKLNNFLILEARFGPKRRGNWTSVRPGISFSPVQKGTIQRQVSQLHYTKPSERVIFEVEIQQLTFLANSQCDYTQVWVNYTTSDGLAFPLASSSLSKTWMSILE